MCTGQFGFYSQPRPSSSTSNNSSSPSSVGPCSASNIVDFIDRAVALSRAGQCLYFLRPRAAGQPPVPVQLLYPVARPAATATATASLSRDADQWTVDRDHRSLRRQTSSSAAAVGLDAVAAAARRRCSLQPASLRQLCRLAVDGDEDDDRCLRRRQCGDDDSPPPAAPPRRRSATVAASGPTSTAATPSRRSVRETEC